MDVGRKYTLFWYFPILSFCDDMMDPSNGPLMAPSNPLMMPTDIMHILLAVPSSKKHFLESIRIFLLLLVNPIFFLLHNSNYFLSI